MADGELSQLDERLREVAESLAAIGTSVKTLEGQVTTMNKALFQGNGHPSLMTQVENDYSHYHGGIGLAGDHRRVSGITQIKERYERSIEGITTQP